MLCNLYEQDEENCFYGEDCLSTGINSMLKD